MDTSAPAHIHARIRELNHRIRELEAENKRMQDAIKRIQKIVPWDRPLLMIEQDEVARSLQEALKGKQVKANRLWFMFDNHTFAEVDLSRPLAHSLELFYRDPCGSLFVRDADDKTLPQQVHGRGEKDPNLEERLTSMLQEVLENTDGR